jgi:hypothetical protein
MPSQMSLPASGAHGTCPACHTLDTPLSQRDVGDGGTRGFHQSFRYTPLQFPFSHVNQPEVVHVIKYAHR